MGTRWLPACARLAGAAAGLCAVTLATAQEAGDEAEEGRRAGRVLQIDTSAGLRQDEELEFRSSIGLSVSTETRIQRLSFGTGVTFERPLTGEDEAEATRPDARLDYRRDTGASLLTLSGDFATREVDGSVPGPDFEFDETDLVEDDGEREDLRLSFGAAIGRRAPLGLELDASLRERTFSDTEDPDLFDLETTTVTAAIVLRPNPRLSARLVAEESRTDREGDANSDEERSRAGARIDWRPTPRDRLQFGLFASETESERRRDDGDLVTETESGVDIELDYTRSRPNGRIGFGIDRQITVNGALDTIDATRVLSLPRDGRLRATAGVSSFASGESAVVGVLAWEQALTRGTAISVNARRSAGVDNDDLDILRTSLNAALTAPLSRVSSVTFEAGFAETDIVDDGSDEDRSSVEYGATYRRALTRDWDLATGYERRVTSEDGDRTDEDDILFLNLQRSFSVRF